MAKFLLAASILWPTVLAAGWYSRTHDGPAWLTASVYLTASHVCHQRPERSFWTSDAPWPVCGRCSGLYLSAPFGALAAFVTLRRRTQLPPVAWLVAAAVPTAATLGIEWLGLAPVSSLARAVAALPLGAAAAFFVVGVTQDRESASAEKPTPGVGF